MIGVRAQVRSGCSLCPGRVSCETRAVRRSLTEVRSRCGAVRIFGHGKVTFRGRRKGNLVFWWSKVDSRDRCKGSQRCEIEMQISWQAQHLGYGDLRRALIS